MSETSIQDTPTHRLRYEELPPDLQESILEAIRERRLATLRVYEELQARKREAHDEKLREKADKLGVRIAKKLEALDKSILDVDKLIKDAKAIMVLLETEA